MADSFKWLLELVDKVSGPAKKATSSTEGFSDELSKLEKQIAKVKADPGGFKSVQKAKQELAELRRGAGGGNRFFGGLAESVESIRNMEGIQLLGEGLHFAYEVGEKVVDTIGEIGEKFIEATGKEERYRISFRALLGDAADETQEYLKHIAGAGELTNTELEAMSTRLLTVGFDAKELGQVLPASLDIAGFLGGGVDKANEAAEALAHIKTTGEISKRSIGSLGLQYAQVMDELKKETGLTTDEITKKLSSGKFGPQVLHAVLQSIANREGGALGNTAEKMGQTIEARLKRLKDLPEEFFKGLVTSKGFDEFSSFVGKLAEELSPDSPFGQEVMKGLEEIGDVIAETFGVKGGSAIETTKNLIRGTVSFAKDMVPVLADIAKAVADIAHGAQEAYRIYQKITGLGDKAAQNAADAQTGTVTHKDLGDGVHLSLDRQDREAALKRAGKGGFFHGLFTSDSTLTKEAMDQLGKEGSIRSPFAPAIPSQAPKVAGTTGGSTTNNSATVHVTVAHDGNADSDEIAQKTAAALPGAIQQAHERMAVATGAL